MYTQTLFALALQAFTSYAVADQFGTLEKDIASLENAHSDVANSVFAWADTETSVPTNVLENQFDNYFDVLVSETTAPIPGFLTYLPTALETPASKLLVSEASLVASDLAPTAGTGGVNGTTTVTGTSMSSVAEMTRYVTSKMTESGTAGTTGVRNSTNRTKPMTGPSSGPMVPPKFTTGAPKTQSKNGASQPTGILVAVGAGPAGVLGVLLFL